MNLNYMREESSKIQKARLIENNVLNILWSVDGSDDDMESVGQGWRTMTQRILKEAPCTVGVLVDRGFGSEEQVGSTDEAYRVCVVFFGGPDDREALELAGRMAEHPRVRVTVVRFTTPEKDGEEKKPSVTLRPSQRKSLEKSYTFSTADVDHEREKVYRLPPST